MSDPINYSFVTTKTLFLDEDDGSKTPLDILVLDKEANSAYWKKVRSFKETAKLVTETDKPRLWKMNEDFVDLAVHDLISEEFNPELNIPTIFGVPVEIVGYGDTPFCVLELEDNTEIKNTF